MGPARYVLTSIPDPGTLLQLKTFGFRKIPNCINDVVYGNGWNGYGQLVPAIDNDYIDDPNKINIPVKIDANLIKDKIIQIECGIGHSVFLTDRGKMFACGLNGRFECGIDNGKESIDIVTKIQCTAFIKEIKCASYHSLCISDRDILYVFGFNECNQLCIKSEEYIKTPTVYPSYFSRIKQSNLFMQEEFYL